MPAARAWALAGVTLAALGVSTPPPVRPVTPPTGVARPAPVPLAVGGTAFVTGPGPEACAVPAGACWDHVLDVRDGGERLRLGVDHVVVGDLFTVEVVPPGTAPVTFGPGPVHYSAEHVFDHPAPGPWRVRVTAAGVTDERYRLRALLAGPAPPPRHEPAPPNLQVLPPYDFTFLRPLTNGSTGGAPRGVPSSGGRDSCHAEEVRDERPVRCLRMAFGVRNTGEGPLALRYADGVPTADRALYQQVAYGDRGHEERLAGLARYHATHGHFHHHDAVELRLWRVTDAARGTLEPAGAVRRKGFAHSNELLREWSRFYPVSEYDGFGLRPGWGDYYEWDRPGNFLDLGTHGDGEYVVRMTVDPTGGIVESNERDNAGYTHFRVTGDAVRTLESGRGSDPWDRCKVVVPIGAEFAPDVPQPVRPADCPPDTA